MSKNQSMDLYVKGSQNQANRPRQSGSVGREGSTDRRSMEPLKRFKNDVLGQNKTSLKSNVGLGRLYGGGISYLVI